MTKKRLSSKLTVLILFLLLTGFFGVPKAHATLSNISDTVTTSRPSSAAFLTGEIGANDGQAQITDNGSIFLSSDSAKIYPTAGETLDTGKNIASMSAAGVPSAGNRVVYLSGPCPGAGCFAGAHHVAMDVLVANITAVHTITFNSSVSIPVGGRIMITFPGEGSNIASPSATTFSFNGLVSSQVTFAGTGSSCGSGQITVAAPAIYCTVATAPVSAGAITITVGTVPTLINPTKTSAAGTADLWKLQLETTNGTTTIDSARATIGTIESVQIQATVDPTLTFTIAPVSGNINSSNNNGSCVGVTDTVNAGIASTATNINLGLLNTANINVSAQLITISTNGIHGYSLTATSSGHLMDPASGVGIPDSSSSPQTMAANTPWFGIHPCGLNANTGFFGSGSMGTALYGWPTITTPLTLASAATGPIGNTAATGGVGAGLTTIEYAAAVDVSVPAGNYISTITYTATPTF